MNMKPMQKTAIKPIPAAKNFNTVQKPSLFTRLFGFESQSVVNALRSENQELILMNQRNTESIKSLSDQLAESLSFQQNNFQSISERLKIMENLPAKQEALHQKIMDSFDRATFFIQNASQDLVQAKSNLLATQNDSLECSGAIEIAEFMRNFLMSNLLAKQIRSVLQSIVEDKLNTKDAEIHLSKLQKNLQIVHHQASQINFKLEKYNLKIEDSIWKPYAPELQTAEVTEHCSSDEFYLILKLSQKIGIFEEGEKIKSLVIAETLPAISFFNKEKSAWVVRRRAKVVILKPN
jgi:hypothetical protein